MDTINCDSKADKIMHCGISFVTFRSADIAQVEMGAVNSVEYITWPLKFAEFFHVESFVCASVNLTLRLSTRRLRSFQYLMYS